MVYLGFNKKMKNQSLVLFVMVICSFSFVDILWCDEGEEKRSGYDAVGLDDEEIQVGVILDMGSWQGKVMHNSISMGISDFCVQKGSKGRVILHLRDSYGDPLLALSHAHNLLEDTKVEAIIGAQTSTETKFLTEFSDRNKIPLISLPKPNSFSFSTRSPFFLQIGNDQISQIKGIASFIKLHQWRNVIIIHQEYDLAIDNNDYDDDDDDDGMLSAMASFLEEKDIHVSFITAISASSQDDQIIEQLNELTTLQTGVFIVHLPYSLASRLFMNAKRLGMMSKGYAWIVTSKTMNDFDSLSIIDESMQGVIGFRSYISTSSNKLQKFNSRLRRDLDLHDPPPADALHLGLLAYEVAWSISKVADRSIGELDAYRTTIRRSMLLREISRSNFKGSKLISRTFEIVNVVDNVAKRVGFCTSTGKITTQTHESNSGTQRTENFEQIIIWPGGSFIAPRGREARMLQSSSGEMLRIGVPVREGFKQLVGVKRDPVTNSTEISGFCIDVFKAALEGLKYQVLYEFIPFMDGNGKSAGTYTDLIHQVYLKKLDAVVGDTTITASRSLLVDFTISFTDIGVGIIAPTNNKDIWIFSKPLTFKLWLTLIGFHILSSFIIWIIERQTPQDVVQGFFTILFGRWQQLENRCSIFVAAVSLFVIFILGSSYTATLASMMTVQHIELYSKRSFIGYLSTSNITKGVLINNLNFENDTLKPVPTADQYANALSKGSRNGGVSAVLDEMPYIKLFLAEHPGDYSLVKSLPTTNGFGFVFPKDSPLVPDISREILKLRESGKLNSLENTWFKSRATLTSKDNAASNIKPLTPTNFGGLFLITVGLSVASFLIFQLPLLHRLYFHVMKKWMMDFKSFIGKKVEFIINFFKKKKMARQSSAAIHPQACNNLLVYGTAIFLGLPTYLLFIYPIRDSLGISYRREAFLLAIRSDPYLEL